MSKLAELLESRKAMSGAANLANPANLGSEFRNIRNFRRGVEPDSVFSPELERRINAMAARWNYSPEDYCDVLERAKRDPAAWEQAVSFDEEREAAFRANGILPKADM